MSYFFIFAICHFQGNIWKQLGRNTVQKNSIMKNIWNMTPFQQWMLFMINIFAILKDCRQNITESILDLPQHNLSRDKLKDYSPRYLQNIQICKPKIYFVKFFDFRHYCKIHLFESFMFYCYSEFKWHLLNQK